MTIFLFGGFWGAWRCLAVSIWVVCDAVVVGCVGSAVPVDVDVSVGLMLFKLGGC